MKSTIFLAAFIAASIPAVPYGDCITPDAAVQFANSDIERIVGNIRVQLAQRDAYANVMPAGTTPDESPTTRTISQEMAFMGPDQAVPTFVPVGTVCGTNGQLADVGSTEFIEVLENRRGRGPRICVKTTYGTFLPSYKAAERSLRDGVVDFIIADKQAQMVLRSGSKLVVQSGRTFDEMYRGDYNVVSAPFATEDIGLPNAPLNFRVLQKAASFLREDLNVDAFEGRAGGTMRFIGSYEIVEHLRDQLDVREDMHALTTGRYDLGHDTITGYSWRGPYRGIELGFARYPLRFNELDEDGQPIFIDPKVRVVASAGSKGAFARNNPAWLSAKYEVAVFAGRDTFMRNTPAPYSGGAGFKFPPQLANAKLEFVAQRDNDCNQFRDFGQHLYEIERSYRPVVPHGAMAIAYQRCVPNLQLVECEAPEPYYGGDEEV